MLHLIFQSPIETAILERLGTGDDVVFLENAVLRILANGTLNTSLSQLIPEHQFYVLADDLTVRGISVNELLSGIEVIDYAAFVELTIKNSVIQSWI